MEHVMEHFCVFCDHELSRVQLRVPEKFDADTVLPWLNDEEIRSLTLRFAPIMREGEEAYFSRMAQTTEKRHAVTDATFMIVNKKSKTSIGVIGLHQIDWRNRRATTGTIIGPPDMRSKGYGTEAKMLLLRWAFNELGLLKIESRVLATNARSQRYSEKCGYKRVGLLKRHHFRRGSWVDEAVLEVYVNTWRKLWKRFEKGEFSPRPSDTEEMFPGHAIAHNLR